MPDPLLSVCVCTQDRPGYLADCLEGLRHQTAASELFEVLVVDSASAPVASTSIRAVVEAYRHGDGEAAAHLIRLDKPGLSRARNAGARTARANYICYIDDDAIPSPNLVEMALQAITGADRAPALIGGRILPLWEAPLPRWWPARLRGVLSIVEDVGAGEYRSPDLPPDLEPCGANFIVHVPALLAAGGFSTTAGRSGSSLLSDEEVQLAWRLQRAGHSVRYDSGLVVRHQIQATRLTPVWLLSRLHWQGVSAVLTRRTLGRSGAVWRELPRRMVVALLFAPAGLLPRRSVRLIGMRWRLAYALGFLRGAAFWRLSPARDAVPD
ncbi:MAG TPA: glycosyltransferase [Acetobacteraceae bacterium]|nr:glycosyltransferase [Acetobacteraceae bacterium]